MSYTDTQERFRAVIVITKISPPTGKGKSYRIDTENGNVYWIYPDKLGLINEDQEYDVEGVINANWHNITKVTHLGAAPPAPQAKKEPKHEPKKEPKKMDYYRPRDPDEQRQIWVCAMLGREIDMGRTLMDANELVKRGQIHMAVWDVLFDPDQALERRRDAARSLD